MGAAVVGNNILRSVLCALLRTGSLEQVRRFWRAHPLSADGRTFTEAELYQYLWDESGTTPIRYFAEVLSDAERYVHELDLDVAAFAERIHFHVNRGSYVGAKKVLGVVASILPDLLEADDPHFAILRVTAGICKLDFRDAIVHFVRSGDSPQCAYGFFVPDPAFEAPALFDPNLYANRNFQAFPQAFFLPPYTSVWHPVDAQPVEVTILEREWSLGEGDGGVLTIAGQAYGRRMLLSEFLRREEIPRAPFTHPDVHVVSIDRPYLCPIRRRVVLHERTAYGAPFYVVRLHWEKATLDASKFLNPVVREISEEAFAEDAELIDLHRQLIAASERRLVFEYSTRAQAVLLDGKVVVSGVPALILRKILIDYEKGQRSFDHRAFKYDGDIFPDPKATNFELRLSRLKGKLSEATDLARIERTREGEFAFHADCVVELRNVAQG